MAESSSEENEDEDEDDEEEKTVWFDCLTGMEGARWKINRQKYGEFWYEEWKSLGRGLEEIYRNVGKMQEFPSGNKMDETEKKVKGKINENIHRFFVIKSWFCIWYVYFNLYHKQLMTKKMF